jgi:hypothetical protein
MTNCQNFQKYFSRPSSLNNYSGLPPNNTFLNFVIVMIDIVFCNFITKIEF